MLTEFLKRLEGQTTTALRTIEANESERSFDKHLAHRCVSAALLHGPLSRCLIGHRVVWEEDESKLLSPAAAGEEVKTSAKVTLAEANGKGVYLHYEGESRVAERIVAKHAGRILVSY